MVRLYGRGRRGERVRGCIPDARWKSLSILSSLRFDGSTEAIIYEGGLTGEFFHKWVKENFIKTLKSGDIVILDNMSSHKVAGIRELMWLRKAGKRTTSELIEETSKALCNITPKDAQGWYRHCGCYL